MKTVKFGIVGCGLMGREFASAAARWCHLAGDIPAPQIVAVADPNPGARQWFQQNIPALQLATGDYHELLELEQVEAVYCAIPHVLHEQVYCDIIRSGKHLMGEKPFGMDRAQNAAILRAVAEHPEVLVRCSSQFPFFPACQELIRWVQQGKLGQIIEIRAGFNHSSDLDENKPINWKRRVQTNGEYGCMGDLGIHTQHVPLRLGLTPTGVFAQLSKLVDQRPDGRGGMAPCDTWDNALLMCQVETGGRTVPMRLETKRMAPGCTNEWFLELDGQQVSVRFSTNDPNAFCFTQAMGAEQAWCRVNVGYKPLFPTITGSIFEFGFPDAILQMWAAFLSELDARATPFGCVTPAETALSHELQTAALLSHKEGRMVRLKETNTLGLQEERP